MVVEIVYLCGCSGYNGFAMVVVVVVVVTPTLTLTHSHVRT